MPYAVVEIHTDSIRGLSVTAVGPYADPEKAEAERRRKHLDRALTTPLSTDPRKYRSFVVPMVTP